MKRLSFTSDEIEQLRKERFTHPHPRVRMKIEALFLKSQRYSHKEIGKLIGISQKTLREYLGQYELGGIEGLKVLHFHKPTSPLEEYREIIEKDFKKNPPATLNEAASRVEKLTGIQRSSKQIGRFLKK